MNLLALLLLAVTSATTARIEAVNLTTAESRSAVRVVLSGRPGMVAVHREGDGARISIAGAELGGAFAGGTRFAWTPAGGSGPDQLSAPAHLDRIEVEASSGEVNVLLRVPPEISIDVRRYRNGLLLVLREASEDAEPAHVARATPPSPGAPMEPAASVATVEPPTTAEAPEPEPPELADAAEPPPPPVVESGPAPEPPAAAADTAELAMALFSAATPTDAGSTGEGSVDALYAQLFPGGAPQTQAETVEPAVDVTGDGLGVPFGPFRVRGAVDVRYADADTFVSGPQSAARDRYLEVAPRIIAEAPLSDGRFELQYAPAFRAFATFEDVNTTSHRVRAGLDLPVGPSVTLYLKDSFVSGTLDTREVDPGGEYFFGLGHFRRNMLDGGASILLGQRMSLELRGATGAVRFQEPSSFFDYDRRLASAGLGFELGPNLKTTFWYQYDEVPTPGERAQAETTAHNAQATISGDILPLVSGELMLGFRDQKTPNADPGGVRFTGLTMAGSLTKQFGRESSATLFLNRSTPVSNFEGNGFYVFTAIQGSGRFPLPLELQLQGGVGYQWSDYQTASAELGVPREDRILGWYVGLRRGVYRHLFLSATYRREERRSNLNSFDTNANGFILQLEWDIFGNTP